LARVDAAALHLALRRCGVNAVLRASSRREGPRVSFVITARHTAAQIDEAVRQLALCLSVLSSQTKHKGYDDVDHSRWLHSFDAAVSRSTNVSTMAAAV
jgi:hypothetical protein